ncbi:MAG: peptidylprolyl isomerase [Gemmatimonadetes bacterium]|nr:peptidylprolyl isomerase [Gemmatimonadota bacterium]
MSRDFVLRGYPPRAAGATGVAVACLVACLVAATAVLAPPAPLPAQSRSTLRSPNATELARAGPDSFDVGLYTTKGAITVRLRRAWAPKGSDRVWHAVQARYYDGVRFYRVIPGFMAQFGFHGDPAVTRAWDPYLLPDEPAKQSNARGTLTFANRGRNTRNVQLFINTANNESLDRLGFAPVGSVLTGLSVADSLYAGYGEGAPSGDGPDQGRIASQGNAYLTRLFPKLDGIDSVRVIQRWPR